MKTKMTPAPAGLLLAETVLELLREKARETDLWQESSINTNEMLGPGTSFQDLRLVCDEVPDYELFLDKHWEAAKGTEGDSTSCFVARDAEPHYVSIRTFARLAYLQALQDWAHALDGQCVELIEDESWTWDRDVTTSTGQSLYRRAFLLTVQLQANKAPFNARKWLKTAGKDICASDDKRADRCVFQLAEEAKLPTQSLFSFTYKNYGFETESETTAQAERVRDKLFADCKVALTPATGRKSARLQITLPA